MKLRDWDINPATAEEVREIETVAGVRKRIQRYARNDSMTRATMDMAYAQGLSGEDTMTLLAFNALCWREKLMDAELDRGALNPNPPLMRWNPSTSEMESFNYADEQKATKPR